jgi:hypothetical protein
MSLAYSAAPINECYNNNNDIYTNDTPTAVAAKRQTNNHNKTQKKIPNTAQNYAINKDKVKSVLNSIHQNDSSFENNDYMLGEFNPPPKPESIGTVKTEGTTTECDNGTECLTNLTSSMSNNSNIPQPNQNDNIELQSLNKSFMNEEQVQQYFKHLGKNTNSNISNINPQQVLIDKLNYMINLLEEKQDERTNNVTEEVVLYSFLGIFIIFIVDSFARVGKYVR